MSQSEPLQRRFKRRGFHFDQASILALGGGGDAEAGGGFTFDEEGGVPRAFDLSMMEKGGMGSLLESL